MKATAQQRERIVRFVTTFAVTAVYIISALTIVRRFR